MNGTDEPLPPSHSWFRQEDGKSASSPLRGGTCVMGEVGCLRGSLWLFASSHKRMQKAIGHL